MVKTKTSTRKSKSKSISEHDGYTAELSTGQLVIGVCILLMLMLGCFLMGVVIGRFDPTPYTVATLDGRAVEASVSVPPVDKPGETVREQSANPTPTVTAKSTPPPEMRVPLRTLGNKHSAEPIKSTGTTEADSSTVTASDSTDRATTKQEELPRSVQQAKITPGKAAPVVEKTPVQTAMRDTKARYGVQIAALGSRGRAETLKKDLETNSSYRADVLPVGDDKILKVLVGSYADYETASHVRDELRSKYGMKDCFVTVRP